MDRSSDPNGFGTASGTSGAGVRWRCASSWYAARMLPRAAPAGGAPTSAAAATAAAQPDQTARRIAPNANPNGRAGATARLGRQRQLARRLAEARLDQQRAERRPDDRLTVEALNGD